MDISAEALIKAFQQQFPKEFTICYQSVQIAALTAQIESHAHEHEHHHEEDE